MFNRRSLTSYLMIDHRNSPGITPEQAALSPGAIPVGKGRLFEADTVNCSHCSRLIVLNPQRSRERGYCPKCDRHICDECEAVRVAAGGACRPWKKLIDDFIDAGAKGKL